MTSGSAVWRIRTFLRRRAALGLHPAAAPILVFVPLGMLLGPSGLGLLSRPALDHLDVVVTIALSTLGVLIGLSVAPQARTSRRLLLVSAVEAIVTMAIVGGATALLLWAWGMGSGMPAFVTAAGLGVCAAASASSADDESIDPGRQVAARVADLDDVLPICVGAALLAVLRSDLAAWQAVGLTIGLGLGVALCGWLLLERARGTAERGVFVLGTLAFLGGAPAYLQLSPLLAGLVAGWFWVRAPGGCDRLVAAELRKLQHPLIVLLLITAGAWVVPTLVGLWLFVPYVVFRLAGKLLGGHAAAALAGGAAPPSLGAYLVPPGAIGIAFALNIHQVLGDAAAPFVFAVTVGALASELIGFVVTPAPRVE